MLRTIISFLMLPFSAHALELSMPVGLEQVAQNKSALETIELPVNVWNGSNVPNVKLAGAVTHTAFQSNIASKPDIVAAALLKQLIKQGYTLGLQCADQACGGYDFRFSLPIMMPPTMYVDLGNYTFLSAYKGKGHAVWILVSQSLGHTHMQMTQVRLANDIDVKFSALPIPKSPDQLFDRLVETGHFILSDLSFEAGSANLDGNTFPSLLALSQFLSANLDQSIILVGHTDSSGSPVKNLKLSKQRAQAVQAMLLTKFPDIKSERVSYQGIGHLAPVASNATPEGREINRRVEVIIAPEK